MKVIQLTQDLVAFVDDADYATLSRYKWHAHRCGKHIYAGRTTTLSGTGKSRKRKIILMHTCIIPGSPEVDHRSGNGLDNRRFNLRPATRRQNGSNQRKTRGRSKYKGVVLKRSGKWQAQICQRIEGKLHTTYLGSFTRELDAAAAYDTAASKMHGEFANLNFA